MTRWVSIDSATAAATEPDMKLMPEHHDGGRAFLVWAIGLWTKRIVRVWDIDGNHNDMQTFSGHTYFAGFLGPKHQVRHEQHTGEHALENERLGPMEVVLFIRSTCFRHNKLSNACRIPGESLLVRALMSAVVQWQKKHQLFIPNMEDIEEVIDSEAATSLAIDQKTHARKNESASSIDKQVPAHKKRRF